MTSLSWWRSPPGDASGFTRLTTTSSGRASRIGIRSSSGEDLNRWLEQYISCCTSSWRDEESVNRVRFVVLDSETTGLNPAVDRLVTIGAVAVLDGDILLDDAFSALILIDHNTEAVTVHGVTRDQARAGLEEAEAVTAFLDYLRDGVIVGHHIGHDIETIDAALGRLWVPGC